MTKTSYFFVVAAVLSAGVLPIASSQEEKITESKNDLNCGPFLRVLGSSDDIDNALDRLESFDDDETRCVAMHIEICPDLLMRQCKDNGWGEGVGGGCEHLVTRNPVIYLEHAVKVCAKDGL